MNPQLGVLADLPSPNMRAMKDPLDRYVANLPFARTQVTLFGSIVDLTQSNPQMPSPCSLDHLKVALQSPAGKDFTDAVIYDSIFKSAMAVIKEKSQILHYYPPHLSLKILGILWCFGEQRDKSYVLTQLVNPPDQNYQLIATNDIDLRDSLQLMFYFAS